MKDIKRVKWTWTWKKLLSYESTRLADNERVGLLKFSRNKFWRNKNRQRVEARSLRENFKRPSTTTWSASKISYENNFFSVHYTRSMVLKKFSDLLVYLTFLAQFARCSGWSRWLRRRWTHRSPPTQRCWCTRRWNKYWIYTCLTFMIYNICDRYVHV